MQSIDKADTVWPHEVYRLLKETVIKQVNMTMINVTKATVHCDNIVRELTYTMKSRKGFLRRWLSWMNTVRSVGKPWWKWEKNFLIYRIVMGKEIKSSVFYDSMWSFSTAKISDPDLEYNMILKCKEEIKKFHFISMLSMFKGALYWLQFTK